MPEFEVILRCGATRIGIAEGRYWIERGNGWVVIADCEAQALFDAWALA